MKSKKKEFKKLRAGLVQCMKDMEREVINKKMSTCVAVLQDMAVDQEFKKWRTAVLKVGAEKEQEKLRLVR